ncbi:hypothetical protein ABPG72_017733 [Tetrahymena utriculariae]
MENNQQVLAYEDQVQTQDQNCDEENCLIILQIKRPEVLLVVVAALILTIAWFEIVCFVKHDHDQMKLKLIQKQQKDLYSFSFVQLPHSQVKSEGDSDDIDQSAELNIQKRDKFDLIEELEAFNANYSADLMSLVLYSNHSIEDLQEFIVKSDFDKIPVTKNEPLNLPKEPYDESVYKKIYKFKLDKQEYKCLQLCVIVDNKDFNNRHDFNDYFKQALSTSERGAFYQQMKAKNYISTIDFGRFQRAENFETYMLEVNLTDDGYQNLEEVIRSYFVFIQEFKESVIKENFEEMKHFQQLIFDYDSNEDIDQDNVSDFATYINYSEEPLYLFLQSRYKNFRKKDFQAYLDQIGDIRKNLIFISSNDFENVKINSKIIPSIDNTFTKGDEYFNTFYDVVVHLNDEQINYLISKQSGEHNFVFTLDLELVPRGKIHFYDANKDDSQLIAQKVDLSFLEHKVPNFVSTLKRYVLNSSFFFNNLKKQKKYFLLKIYSKNPLKPINQAINNLILTLFFFKEEYSQDPFMRNDRSSMFKFGFSQEGWSRILEEENSDNKYIPLMLINNENINSFIMINFDKDEPQTVCKLKLVNKNRGLFGSKEQTTFNQVYLTAQMRHLEDQYTSTFEQNYGIGFQVTEKDVQMSVYGWNSKFEKVASNFMKNIQVYQLNQEEWNAAADNLILKIQKDVSEYHIFKYAQKETMFSLLDDQFILSKDRIDLIQNSKLEDIEKFKSNLFTATNKDFLYSGNVSPKKSIEYTNTFKNLFEITKAKEDQSVDRSFNIVNLQNKYYVYQQLNENFDDTNSAIVNVYQFGERNIKNYIYLNLLQDKLDRFFYNFLRTKEGLGYVAGFSTAAIGCVDHLTIVLQGDKKQLNEINIYMEKGLKQFTKTLNKVTEEDFQESINSFKAGIENLPVSLEDKLTYMWTQIDREKYDFDIRYYFLNQLETEITLQGMKDFYNYHMREHASKLSKQIFSQAKPYDLNNLKVKNYGKNLKDLFIIKSKEDIVNLNQENPYFKCNFKTS